jgi:hypothetical protein
MHKVFSDFTSRCLVAASNGGCPLPLGSRIVPDLSYQLLTHHNSKSKLFYDWRFSANQFVLAPSSLRLTTSNFFQLNPCGHSPHVTSLMRGRVCRLQLLLALTSAVILGFDSCGTHDHILLSQIRDSPNLEGQAPVFISPRNRVTRLYSQALGSLFIVSYDSQGYGGGIRTRLRAFLLLLRVSSLSWK